jgi:multidrug efflux pump subunit AcrA (membrane-fusion protein)
LNMANESKPNPQQATQAAHHHDTAPQQKPISPGAVALGAAVVLIVAVLLGVFGVLSRRSADTVLAERTQELAPPSVIAVAPKPGAPVDSFVLPGNVTAYTDSPIYARTSGYLTRWYFDIGARVK